MRLSPLLVGAAALATCVLGATPAAAQAVLDSPKGPIEVIGLRQWTLRMLEDSVAAREPGETLRSHACAAILQGKLGFPAAAVSVMTVQEAPDAKPTTSILITLVEPGDSSRVQLRRLAGGAALPAAKWAGLRGVATDAKGLRINELLFAMQFYRLYRAAPDSAADIVRLFGPDRLPVVQAIWREVARLDAPGDFTTALRTTRGDTSWAHRILAVSVLANFATRDATWHALVAAMRDPDERVRNAAGTVMERLAQREARPVDWRPAQEDLRALIGGTNVWNYRELLAVLGKTQVAPALAPALLRDNTHLLLGHLHAQSAAAHEPALAVVRQFANRPAMSRDEGVAWLAGF